MRRLEGSIERDFGGSKTRKKQRIKPEFTLEKKSGILIDALNYINQLKLKVEEMTKEYGELVKQGHHQPTMDVKVEKLENSCFMVRLTCEKVQDLLISLVEAFEKMGLEVLHADINSNQNFQMEAIIEAEDETLDVDSITQSVYKVLENMGVEKTGSNN
ncbi:hypothetical protein IFM89_004720 [Coptis chinensis]|uniref:Plant bHLH transcription factor ACT-like domain-containing protein n=1 Tax=Coptis chinensis TaxID=261450 RepID=A0A835GYY5_9MAGN|nr:hypothetical protein IFM89_004720 [Coptis chinensis]